MARKSTGPGLTFALKIMARAALQPMQGSQRKPLMARPDELAVTFLGHASFLLQIGGLRILVDPVYATWLIALRRQRYPGVKMRDLPPIDAVLLTHAHMDHLNRPTLRQIIRHTRRFSGKAPIVVVPEGVQDLVESLGFESITRMQWWSSLRLRQVEVTMTPAQHWGARMLRDTHRGYGGYVLRSGAHSVYHSGDSGYFDGFHEIGERLHPKVALLPIGAYKPDSFRRVHTSPEDALMAFHDLSAETMIPMHYGTFCLSEEPMGEPLARLMAAAQTAGMANRIQGLAEGDTTIFP